MSDIVEHLRDCAKYADEYPSDKDAFNGAAKEITRLREENARYKQSYQQYVEATDRMNGTPCEQIRHEQQLEALREENARLRETLQYIADPYNNSTTSKDRLAFLARKALGGGDG